jgi:hypothetical protein
MIATGNQEGRSMKPQLQKPSRIRDCDGPDSPLAAATAFRDKGILGKVRRALARHDVLLAYQPVVYASDPDNVAFYEGLIRILDDTGRASSPRAISWATWRNGTSGGGSTAPRW